MMPARRSLLLASNFFLWTVPGPLFSASTPSRISIYETSAVDRFAVTAHHLALGGAGSALTDNPDALILNPAALPTIRMNGVHLLVSGLATGMRFYSMAYAGRPIRHVGSLSAAYMRLDSGDITGRATETAEPFKYEASDQSFVLGYARDLWPRFGLLAGTTFRFRRQQIDTLRANGFGMDGGLFHQFILSPNNKLNVGGVLQDAVPMKTRLEGTVLRRGNLRGGMGFEWTHQCGNLPAKLVLGWDAARDHLGALGHAAGAEYVIDMFSLRAGFKKNELAFGFGARLTRQAQTYLLDYALLNHIYAQSHTFSLSWLFGPAPEGLRRADEVRPPEAPRAPVKKRFKNSPWRRR
ncbi:MAG: hypothetical protein HY548_04700 [Elusimicrobia bacterium]|nr:hypothetical protein [Elusimicrobiota bacterium]